jgi:hypothetical protein
MALGLIYCGHQIGRGENSLQMMYKEITHADCAGSAFLVYFLEYFP